MASGKAHARSTSQTIIIACSVVGVAMLPAHIVSFVLGLVVGHYAPPDVRDQQKIRNHGERMVRDHFGKAAGWLWSMWWEPLAMCVPHRSPWSHLPIMATCLAAVWLYWLPMVALWYYAPGWYDTMWVLIPYHVAGWALQDGVHLWQDGGLRKGIRW